MAVQIKTEKVKTQQLQLIQNILLDFCRYVPIEPGPSLPVWNSWFGCLPGTKRERWYSYLLHDENGNLLMLIDPKTKTVKKF